MKALKLSVGALIILGFFFGLGYSQYINGDSVREILIRATVAFTCTAVLVFGVVLVVSALVGDQPDK